MPSCGCQLEDLNVSEVVQADSGQWQACTFQVMSVVQSQLKTWTDCSLKVFNEEDGVEKYIDLNCFI